MQLHYLDMPSFLIILIAFLLFLLFFNRPVEAEALLGEPNERRRNLQQQHSLSGITDQPDLTASIR